MKKFWKYLPLPILQVGAILGQYWCAWQALGSGGLDCEALHFDYIVPVPPLSTLVSGTSRVPYLFLRVFEGSGTSERSGQNVGERCFGVGRASRPRVLQSLVSTTESNRMMEADHKSLHSQLLCDSYFLQGGNNRKGDIMLLIDLMDTYFQIPIHPDSRPYLRIVFLNKVYQFKALCFCLSTAPQFFNRVFSLVSDWSHRWGICLLRCLGDWLIIADWVPCLLEHWELLLNLCKDLGIVINCEKSDLKPTNRAQYLGMLLDAIRERVCPTDSQIVRFQEVADNFLCLSSPPLQGRCSSRS